MRKAVLIMVLSLLMVTLLAGVAFAAHTDKGDRTGWATNSAKGCAGCHENSTKHTSGPHGGYTSTTNKCQVCHTVHVADSTVLLPGATVTEACNFCHDLTGTDAAPYYASDLADPTYGNDVKASHRVFGTVGGFVYNATYGQIAIPGGNNADGGTANLDTSAQGPLSGNSGVNGEFTCDSCHTPHALSAQTVDEYLGESHVKISTRNDAGAGLPAGQERLYMTSRILKRVVNGNDTGGTYGAKWCAGCHEGRDDMGAMGGKYNHPVDESAPGYDFEGDGRNPAATVVDAAYKTDINGFKYYLIDSTATDPTRNFSYDPRSNKWFAMAATDPLNGDAARPDGAATFNASGPACQQCHGNPRDVDAAFFTGAWDNGLKEPVEGAGFHSRNNFPHLSTVPSLLTESGDDFCTNCHDSNNLP